MTALGFAQQSVGVLMQCSELLFAFLTLLSLPPLPTVNSTIPKVTLAADIFWHFRKRVFC
ncbi:hypothetical protein M405DRAFT_811528 [Rhizopogon salebrosus TDB-379]|nr:hypothetical protein M405DRAFT_811528 [Rhizopogon salebrosus TDB-379]